MDPNLAQAPTPASSYLPPVLQSDPSSAGLGDLVALYQGKWINRHIWIMRLLPALSFSALLLAIGFWRAYIGYTRFGSVAAQNWGRPWFIGGGIFLIPILLWVLARRQVARWFIGLHQNGLRIHLSRDRKMIMQWNEISGITANMANTHFFGLVLASRNRLTILPNVGEPIHLDDRIENLPELIERLKKGYYPHLKPALKAELYADRWLYFGPLAIHRKGLRVNGRQYTWETIKGISVDGGKLIIDIASQRAYRLPSSQIPNLEVFLEIIYEGVAV